MHGPRSFAVQHGERIARALTTRSVLASAAICSSNIVGGEVDGRSRARTDAVIEQDHRSFARDDARGRRHLPRP